MNPQSKSSIVFPPKPAVISNRDLNNTRQLSKKSCQTTESLIKVSDIETEEEEPKHLDSGLQEVNVILDLQTPDNLKISKNIFECPEYWLSKGYQVQTGKVCLQLQSNNKKARPETDEIRLDKSDEALDFYF